MLVTMTLSDALDNAAAAISAASVGIAMAQGLGVSPDPFPMAIAVAASRAFLTPIRDKDDTSIPRPGGYSFGACGLMDLPFEILVVAVSIPAILASWPLRGAARVPQFRHMAVQDGRGTGSALGRRGRATGRAALPSNGSRAMMKIALMVHAGFATGLLAAVLILI